jgi:hypothetical protein
MFRIPTLITALALLPLTGRAGENVPVDQLPDVVVNAIHVEYPGAKLLKAEVEKEEEVTFYEVHVVHQDIKMEIDVSPEGKVLAVDENLRKQN